MAFTSFSKQVNTIWELAWLPQILWGTYSTVFSDIISYSSLKAIPLNFFIFIILVILSCYGSRSVTANLTESANCFIVNSLGSSFLPPLPSPSPSLSPLYFPKVLSEAKKNCLSDNQKCVNRDGAQFRTDECHLGFHFNLSYFVKKSKNISRRSDIIKGA